MKKMAILPVFSLLVLSAYSQWNLLSNSFVPNISVTAHNSVIVSGLSQFGSADMVISTDGGETWSGVLTGTAGVLYLTVDESFFYACTPNGVLRASTADLNWMPFGNGISGQVHRIRTAGGILMAAGTGGVYKRAPEDTCWMVMSAQSPVSSINDLAFDGSLALLAGYDGIAESYDFGITWTTWPHSLYGFQFDAVTVKGDTILAASGGGIYRKSISSGTISLVNSGLKTLWSPYFTYYGHFSQFHRVGNTLFVGGETGVYKLTGLNWHWEDTGLTGYTDALCDNGSMLIAVQGYQGIWGRQLGQLIVHTGKDTSIPVALSLYPNPARNRLTIRFPASFSGPTVITITALNGQQLLRQTLQDEAFSMDVSDWLPGIYFLMATNGSKTFSGKFVRE
jgi:hypothetical protein